MVHLIAGTGVISLRRRPTCPSLAQAVTSADTCLQVVTLNPPQNRRSPTVPRKEESTMPQHRLLPRRALLDLALGLCLAAAGPAFAVETGQGAPDVDLPGAGVAARLSELRGKVVYVDFWASWCGPCKQSFPWMNEMQKKYAAKGLQIVGINVDARREDADAFLKNVPAQFAVAFDTRADAAKRFDVKIMPTAVLIGRDGKVLFLHQGFREQDRSELEARLAQAVDAAAPKAP